MCAIEEQVIPQRQDGIILIDDFHLQGPKRNQVGGRNVLFSNFHLIAQAAIIRNTHKFNPASREYSKLIKP